MGTHPRNARGQRAQKAMMAHGADLIAETAATVALMPRIDRSTALRARDWRALIGVDADRKIDALVDAVFDDVAVKAGWNEVLGLAGIPWLAWSIMRDDLPEAQDLYRAWQRRKAAKLAEEVLDVADEAIVYLSDPDRNRLRVAARRWMAGVLDPVVYGTKQQVHVTKNSTRRVVVEIVDESVRR